MIPISPSREMEIIRTFKSSAPVKVKEAISALGIAYIEQPMPPDQSGFFARRTGIFVIGVNQNDGIQRRRFTAAHELGHFVLHRDLLQEGEHFDRLYGAAARFNPAGPFSPSHEVQANQFAAEFLMPANMVATDHRNGLGVAQIAKRYEVSGQAAEIRLKNLGLIQ